jgi:hypothetical protein
MSLIVLVLVVPCLISFMLYVTSQPFMRVCRQCDRDFRNTYRVCPFCHPDGWDHTARGSFSPQSDQE